MNTVSSKCISYDNGTLLLKDQLQVSGFHPSRRLPGVGATRIMQMVYNNGKRENLEQVFQYNKSLTNGKWVTTNRRFV